MPLESRESQSNLDFAGSRYCLLLHGRESMRYPLWTFGLSFGSRGVLKSPGRMSLSASAITLPHEHV